MTSGEWMRRRLRTLLSHAGIDADRLVHGAGWSVEEEALLREVTPFTLLSPQRVIAVCDAVEYLTRCRIPGAIVECGVWRGGAMMAAARTLLAAGDASRRLFLYDTFAGMAEPTVVDVDVRGVPAARGMRRHGRDARGNSRWCNASLEDVRANLASTGYPGELCSFVVGKVEDTLPGTLPEAIALLRLDTDWYASTAHELENLVPLIVAGGVLIIDDYGHWQGARRAVDEYLQRRRLDLLLCRTDSTGRMALLPAGGR